MKISTPMNNMIIISEKSKQTLVSYNTIIAVRKTVKGVTKITLDKTYWNHSMTTGKHRNDFLNEGKADTQSKIDSKEYKLSDLNK